MDLLKRELQRKRELLQDFGGRKILKRSEIQRREIQRLRQEELRRMRPKPECLPSDPERSDDGGAGDKASGDLQLSLPLPRDEVIRRLRILKQPTTLFGEDDAARLRRLNEILESGPVEIEEDEEIGDGQTNDFLRDIHELCRRQRAGFVKPKSGGAGDVMEVAEVTGMKCGEESDGGRRGRVDEDGKRMKADFTELGDEDKILVFFKRLLDEWGQEVEGMPEAEKRTAKGKFTVATFNQCARYLNPLFKMCRKKSLPDDIRKALLSVVECCMRRDYLAAMDEYIKLAIGNAPWPIGVTMVGIHERSAHEKICTNSVAHIMNDETTRKYLQSAKRLMTFCQRRYPANPSRSVEFNSLANGSDLQSLLAEEQASNSLGLRLVSAK